VQTQFIADEANLSEREAYRTTQAYTNEKDLDKIDDERNAEMERKRNAIQVPTSFSKQMDFINGSNQQLVQIGFINNDALLSDRDDLKITKAYTTEVDPEDQKRKKELEVKEPKKFAE